MKIDEECSERINVNLEIFEGYTRLQDDEILRVPDLFETFDNDNSTALKGGAFFSGAVNNLVLSGFKTSIGRSPGGPAVDGKDLVSGALANEDPKI